MRSEKRIEELAVRAQRVRAARARDEDVSAEEADYLVEAIVDRRAELAATLREVVTGLEACAALEEQLRGVPLESPEADLLRGELLANI